MPTLKYGRDARLPWWKTRAATVGAFCLIFLVVLFGYAGDSWAIVAFHLVTDGLLLILWLLCAFGIGSVCLKAARIGFGRKSLTVCVSIGLGLGILSLSILMLGLLGWLNRWTSIALVVAPSLCAIYGAYRVRKAAGGMSSTGGWSWLVVALGPLLAIAMLGATVPPGILWGDEPNGYDVVEYHLQVPREWYEAAQIIPLKHNAFSYLPMNVEMHYLLAMHLRGGPWAGMYLAQMMHVGFIALTIFAIYALLADRRAIAIVVSVLAAVFPWMSLLAPVGYNEGGLLLWGTLAIGLSLRGGGKRGWILAGAMAGFACGAELTGVPTILCAVPVAIALAKPQAATVRHGAIFIVLGFLAFSPWLIRNMLWTGNPAFPEATSLFSKAHWSGTQVERWQRANHLPPERLQNIRARVAESWHQIFADSRFGFVLIPLALTAAVLARERWEAWALVILLVLMTIFWIFFTHLQGRFFVLAIPVCAMLIAMVDVKWWLVIVACAAIGVAVGNFAMLDQRLTKYRDQHVMEFLGAENLTDLTPLAGQKLGDLTRVVLVGDAKAFWYQVPMNRLSYRTVFDVDVAPGESSLHAWKRGAAAGDDTISVIDPGELIRFAKTYWMIPLPSEEILLRDRPYVTR